MPEPNPPPALVAELGYTEVVKLGESYASRLGYTTPQIRRAEEISRGIWRLRFGVGASGSGSGRVLELELDARTRALLKSTELTEAEESLLPPPRPSQ